jgi:hypothetical protein
MRGKGRSEERAREKERKERERNGMWNLLKCSLFLRNFVLNMEGECCPSSSLPACLSVVAIVSTEKAIQLCVTSL